ncbi:MAG: tellurium resistance protein TerC [Chloroflexota bacterium]|nr:tellurium resistance protein TerC [Chloroflexota bacterium]
MNLAEGFPIDLALVTIIIQLIFLEGILSIDNAAVLGAMVSVLPDDKPVPYPERLKSLQPFTDRVLGMQRTAALKVGLLGAYFGRALMLLIASFIIQNLWLRLLGAAYLVKLSIDHLPQYMQEDDSDGVSEQDAHSAAVAAAGASFWMVVLQVELADLAFSLDNVVVAISLSEKLWVVLLGVAIGIVTMRFAAGIFTHLIEREPILAPAAYVLVLAIGLRLLLEDLHLFEFPGWYEDNKEWIQFGTSVAILVLAVVYAHSPLLRRIFRPVFHLIGRGMEAINQAISWLFKPVAGLFKSIFQGIKRLIPGVGGDKDQPPPSEAP